MKRVLSAICAIAFAATMTISSFAADYASAPGYTIDTSSATVYSPSDNSTIISSGTGYVGEIGSNSFIALTAADAAKIGSDNLTPSINLATATAGITGLPSGIVSSILVTPGTSGNWGYTLTYGIHVPSNGTWRVYYVDGNVASHPFTTTASGGLVWFSANHASSYLLVKTSSSSNDSWVSGNTSSNNDDSTTASTSTETSTATSASTDTAAVVPGTTPDLATSSIDAAAPGGLPEPPPVVAPGTSTDTTTNAPAVIPGTGTDGGNSAGTGRGSYDQAGNYVGAGNGQYDASGNYVGVVSGTGNAPHTGVAVPSAVVVSAGAIALCVFLMKKKNK